MPGNTVKINEFEDLNWYVGDSKMDELINWLNKNGLKLPIEERKSFLNRLIVATFKRRK